MACRLASVIDLILAATPAGGFADQPVHGLADEIGVPGVPSILLDQVAQQPPQAGMAAVRAGGVDQLA